MCFPPLGRERKGVENPGHWVETAGSRNKRTAQPVPATDGKLITPGVERA